MKKHVLVLLMVSLAVVGCAKVEESKPAAQQKAAPNVLPSLSVAKEAPASAALGRPAPTVDAASAAVQATAPAGTADPNAPKRLTDQELTVLNYAVYKYKEQFGRFPKSLQEMVGTPHLARVPVTPPDQKIVYDPTTGIVKTEKP